MPAKHGTSPAQFLRNVAIRYASSNWFIYARRCLRDASARKEGGGRKEAFRETGRAGRPYTGFSSTSRRNRELRQIRLAPYFSRSWIEPRDFADDRSRRRSSVDGYVRVVASVLRILSHSSGSLHANVIPLERSSFPRNEIPARRVSVCEGNDAGSRFPGTWISRVSCGFRSDGASCFLPFQVRHTSGRPLVRSLNHGLTYLFPRAISAAVLAKIIAASASSIVPLPVRTRASRERDRRRSAKAVESIIARQRDNSHFENASDSASRLTAAGNRPLARVA